MGSGTGMGHCSPELLKFAPSRASTVSVSGHLIGTDGLRYIPIFEGATVVEPIFGDVNRDGVVDIRDLVLVASSFNQPVSEEGNPADVTENDIVNIIDLVKVAAVIGGGAAAPAVLNQRPMDVCSYKRRRAAVALRSTAAELDRCNLTTRHFLSSNSFWQH